MIDLPPLNALRAFEVAGRHLNFRAAADEMRVTQAAVAQQVRALEAHLEIALFERRPRGLAFTSSGRSFHGRVAAAFTDLRFATEVLRPEPDKVLVSVTPTFAARWLIPNLPSFASRYPKIDFRVLATEQLSSFHADGIDLAVRQGRPPTNASLEIVRLFRQQIVAVASPGLLKNAAVPLPKGELAFLPKIHDAHDLWPDFMKAGNTKNECQRSLRLSQTTLAVEAALSGQGVALVSRFLVRRELDAGTLVQVSEQTLDGQNDFYLIAHRERKRDPAVEVAFRWFLSLGEG